MDEGFLPWGRAVAHLVAAAVPEGEGHIGCGDGEEVKGFTVGAMDDIEGVSSIFLYPPAGLFKRYVVEEEHVGVGLGGDTVDVEARVVVLAHHHISTEREEEEEEKEEEKEEKAKEEESTGTLMDVLERRYGVRTDT